MSNVEASFRRWADGYDASAREQQRLFARNHAAEPRRYDSYKRHMEASPLLARIALDPDRSDVCWAVIRELCAYRRWLRTPRGQSLTPASRYGTLAILIRAELIRMKAARSQSLQLAAE